MFGMGGVGEGAVWVSVRTRVSRICAVPNRVRTWVRVQFFCRSDSEGVFSGAPVQWLFPLKS